MDITNLASERIPIQEPLQCTACGQRMQLIKIEPALFYADLAEHAYSCSCGASVTTFEKRAALRKLAVKRQSGRDGGEPRPGDEGERELLPGPSSTSPRQA